MTPFRVLGVLNGGIRWADVQDGRVDLTREEQRRGWLGLQPGRNPEDDPPAESFGVDPDVEWFRRQTHERRDAA